MAVAYNTSSTYDFGSTLETTKSGTVTIDGSGSDRLIIAVFGANRSYYRTLSSATLDGVKPDGIIELGVDGGQAVAGQVAYWLNTNNPGSSSVTLSATYSGNVTGSLVHVVELTGTDQTATLSSASTTTATDENDGTTHAATLTNESGEFVLSWTAFADSGGFDASGSSAPSSNLTEIQDEYATNLRVSVGYDLSCASTSENYSWTISANGTAQVDSIVVGAVAVYAASGGDTSVSATTATLTLTEQAASIGFDVEVAASTDSLSLTTYQASISQNVVVSANTAALALTTNTATVNINTAIEATTGSLNLTAYAAAVSFDVSVQATTSSLNITTYAASVDVTNDTSVEVSTAALTITPFSASIGYDVAIAVASSSLSITEYPATISAAESLADQVAALQAMVDELYIRLDMNESIPNTYTTDATGIRTIVNSSFTITRTEVSSGVYKMVKSDT